MDVETIRRCTDYTYEVNITKEDGSPKNITDWTIFLTMKPMNDKLQDDSGAVISKKYTIHTDPLGGKSNLTLTKDDLTISPKLYSFGLKFIDENGLIIEPSEYPTQINIIDNFTKREE